MAANKHKQSDNNHEKQPKSREEVYKLSVVELSISRDIDLKFIQDTHRVLHNSQIDFDRSKVKVTGTVHCFWKVQSYHKN